MRMPIACRVCYSFSIGFSYGTELLQHTNRLNASRLEWKSYPSDIFIMWPNDMNESILQMGNRLFVVNDDNDDFDIA